MTKFTNKFKKQCFWPILGTFSIFFGRNFFSGRSDFVTYNFICVFSTIPKFRNNDTTPRKCPERWMDRRTNKMMDRPYSLGPFPLPLGTQKGDRSTICLV